jgi:hypothetical protein
MLLVEQATHQLFGDDTDPARRYRGRRAEANRLPGQSAFTEEIAAAQYPHDGVPADRRHHRQLHTAGLNVEDGIGRVALLVDGRLPPIAESTDHCSRNRNGHAAGNDANRCGHDTIGPGIRGIFPTVRKVPRRGERRQNRDGTSGVCRNAGGRAAGLALRCSPLGLKRATGSGRPVIDPATCPRASPGRWSAAAGRRGSENRPDPSPDPG